MRFGEAPVQRAEAALQIQHAAGVEPQRRQLGAVGPGGVERAVGVHEGCHGPRQVQLVGQVRAVKAVADLVLIDPGQLAVEHGLARVEAQGVVAQQADAVLDPAQTVLVADHHDADVVGQVPGVVGPCLGGVRVEHGDPAGELHQLQETPLLLQAVDAEPEDFGGDAAEAAEPGHHEGQGRRHVGGVASVGIGQAGAAGRSQPAALPGRQQDQRGNQGQPSARFGSHVFLLPKTACEVNRIPVRPRVRAVALATEPEVRA